MKILVAGGGGYLGTRLVSKLIEEKHQVEVLDLFWFGNYLPKGVPVHKKDVIEADEAFLQEYDQVIFVAGLSNDPMAEFSPAMNFVSNAAGPAYLAYMSKKAGVKRFIYASSGSGDAYAKGVSMTQKIIGVKNICSGNFLVGMVEKTHAKHFKQTHGVT